MRPCCRIDQVGAVDVDARSLVAAGSATLVKDDAGSSPLVEGPTEVPRERWKPCDEGACPGGGTDVEIGGR